MARLTADGRAGLRICGIDPGLRHTGWGIVDIAGSTLKWVADGTIILTPVSLMLTALPHP